MARRATAPNQCGPLLPPDLHGSGGEPTARPEKRNGCSSVGTELVVAIEESKRGSTKRCSVDIPVTYVLEPSPR